MNMEKALLVRTDFERQQYQLVTEVTLFRYGEIWEGTYSWNYQPVGGEIHSTDSLREAVGGLLDYHALAGIER